MTYPFKVDAWPNVVWYSDLEKFVVETYGIPWSVQQSGDMGQNTVLHVDVDPVPWEDLDRTVYSENYPSERGYFERWLERPTVEDSDFNETLDTEREFSPSAYVLLNDLCAKGLIPKGPLVIYVWW